MTVSTTTRKVNYLVQAGVDTYSFNFYTQDVANIKVLYDDVGQASGFTATLNSDQQASPGGNVVLNPIPAADTRLTILRDVPETQEVDYIPYDEFPAETHEGALDKLTMISQQNSEAIQRAISAPPSDDGTTDFTLPAYDAGKGIMWDPSEKKMKNSVDNFDTLVSDATTQANAAAASASAASGSASAASASSDKAKEWAENPEDVEVEPGQFSALHWAAKAATFNPADYIKSDGSIPMVGDLTISKLNAFLNLSHTAASDSGIINTSAGTLRAKQYFDDSTGNYVVELYSVGGVLLHTWTFKADGNLALGGSATPTVADDLANKGYVDGLELLPVGIVSFQGDGTINHSIGNIASVTRTAAGQYTVAYTTPLTGTPVPIASVWTGSILSVAGGSPGLNQQTITVRRIDSQAYADGDVAFTIYEIGRP